MGEETLARKKSFDKVQKAVKDAKEAASKAKPAATPDTNKVDETGAVADLKKGEENIEKTIEGMAMAKQQAVGPAPASEANKEEEKAEEKAAEKNEEKKANAAKEEKANADKEAAKEKAAEKKRTRRKRQRRLQRRGK